MKMTKNTTQIDYQGMIAPCGMNCGICFGHLREKRPYGVCVKRMMKTSPNIAEAVILLIASSWKKLNRNFVSIVKNIHAQD